MMPIKISSNDQKILFSELFLGDVSQKRYVYGINEYSACLSKLVNIDGFIDDYTDKNVWLGKPVKTLGDIDSDALVVSCVTANLPITALNKLQESGIHQYGDYISLADNSDSRLPQIQAITQTRIDYKKHAARYNWLRHHLSDEISCKAFDSVMDFRLNGNLQAMIDFEYAVDRQYFEPFLSLKNGEVFVDGGGFDGFTTIEFAKRCPNYSTIHFFEPSQKMLKVAQANLAKLRNIQYYELGLYDKKITLSFDSSAGSASRIAENGNEYINVESLDDVISQAVSFIKLDLEGAELNALKGCEKHILSNHPKLAVAVYHHPSDLWRIPSYILSLRSDYKIYLRHYTEGWAETVMFFIPHL